MVEPMPSTRFTLGNNRAERVSILGIAPGRQFVFRGPREVADQCGAAFGVDLPASPCRANRQDGRAALRLGPDEWLLIALPDDAVLASLRHSLSRFGHALVDVSSLDAVFEIRGPSTAILLNAVIPLDLSPKTFPVDACTRTILAKVSVLLWRTDQECFRLQVARSSPAYVHDVLAEAAWGLPDA